MRRILWKKSLKHLRAVMLINTREEMQTPGKKSKLQFPTAMREKLIAECGFTCEEKTILNLRADGLTLLEIADRQNCSVETINRRIRSIKNKIAAIV